MKASTIIMTPDVLQAKSLWGKGEGKKTTKTASACQKQTGTFIQKEGR